MTTAKLDQITNVDLSYYETGTVTRHILNAAASGLTEPVSFDDFKDQVIKTAADQDVKINDMAVEFMLDHDVKDPVMETVLITLDLMEQDQIIDVERICYDGWPPTAEIVSIKLSPDGKRLTDALFG